jgi:hypothetical protein
LDEARSRLADALDEARSRLAAGQEEQARAAREREHLEQVIASMKTAIETLERSRSWRLTAPLRAAARIFARPRDPR